MNKMQNDYGITYDELKWKCGQHTHGETKHLIAYPIT